MEFVKKSATVTDIVIPEGNVIKIHEKETGRVLWEKGLRAEKITSGLPNTNLWSCFDTGSNITFIPFDNPSYFSYNPSTKKSSSLSKMKSYSGHELYGIDIDPVSKTWLAVVRIRGRDPDNLNNYVEDIRLENSQGKLSNAGDGGERTPQWTQCCWMTHLNAFCVIGGTPGVGNSTYTGVCSRLISLQHIIVNTGNNCIPYKISSGTLSYQHQVCYSDTRQKAVIITYPDYNTIKTFASSDGVSWEESLETIDNYNGVADGGKVFWVDGMNSFILFAHGKKEKEDYHYCDIYKSRDGLKWDKIGTGPEFMHGYSGAWSPTEKVFLFVGGASSRTPLALTKDFTKWTKVSSPVSSFDNRCKAIWSKTAKAFIITPLRNNVGFLQITFEK